MPAQIIPIKAPSTRAKRQALIDEFGRLQQKVDAFKPTKIRHEQLREQIAGWYENEAPDQAFVEDGRHYTLTVSERSNVREIKNMPWLFKFLGAGVFLKLCKFNLGDVDKNVPEPQHKHFIEEGQTGARRVKAIAKETTAPDAPETPEEAA